ncbi:MAG: hypothetical protein DCF19_10220 [Pseudanabaena frigida]|uniref:Pentapeptide repeat-containing protein n=1 Tax=Pseudanabaena frigida TaxID=945775 RepID=A0A2W4WGQ1_9CYAN|nr:MAG: hypothetical protein DCF19_10220 [Pseudanabaena frigida]
MALFRSSLKESIAKHKLWLESDGEESQRFSAAGASFEKIDLSNANLSKANLSGANLSGANLSNTNLKEATLFGAKLIGANFNGANLSSAALSGAELQGASLQNTILTDALLCEVTLTGANLSNADLHKANLSLGVPEFIKSKNIQSILSGNVISLISIRQTNLQEANLSGANLSEANLDFADLFAANLSGANLSKAKLFAANLNKANLTNVNLCGADLFRVKALNANFSSADLTDACIEDWIIDSDTRFDEVICKSIYLKHILRSFPDYILRKYRDRRPFNPHTTFAQGDFVKLVSKDKAAIELENRGSDILQERVIIEEMSHIFDNLIDQYSQRYVDASESDRLTLLKLEISYQANFDPAFKLRLLEAIGKPDNQDLTKLLAENTFVSVSQEIIQKWLIAEWKG